MKKKIPFDIKYRPQIESGEVQVETNDGRKVRIVCWDKKANGREDIVAMVMAETGTEVCQIYYSDGRLVSESSCKDRHDLCVIVDMPDLTEFEEKLSALVVDAVHTYCENKNLETPHFVGITLGDDIAREWSQQLLDVALKDVPKWKKIEQGKTLPKRSYMTDGTYFLPMPTDAGITVGRDAWYLPCEEIFKLPKKRINYDNIR